MAELADVRDLGSRAERRKGSTPFTRTIEALTWILIGKLPPASNARQCQAAKICGLVDNACLNIRKQSNQSWICGYVGIGRQASLRCLWSKGRVSSNLTSRTNELIRSSHKDWCQPLTLRRLLIVGASPGTLHCPWIWIVFCCFIT